MKFTIQAKQLKDALTKVLQVVPIKSTLPILQNVYMNLTDTVLTILGTDMTTSLMITIAVKAKANGEIVVPARLLSDIVSSFTDNITFSLNTDTVNIKSGKI